MNNLAISPNSITESKVDVSGAIKSQEQIPDKVAAQPSHEKISPDKENEAASAARAKLADVTLKFQVDEATSDVTVFVVDKTSKRVLRTIPPEELDKLNSGDLLHLFA